MFKKFYPDEYVESAYSVDFRKYYDKGYRALILDVDNTLVEHGAPHDENAVAFFNNVRNIGFKTCIISNNNENRIRPFAEGVASDYISDAAKPSLKGYKKAMELMGSNEKNTMFIGDQLFTDILGANRAGIYCILVKYIKYDTDFFIKLKRLGEKLVLKAYKRHSKK